LEGCKTDAVWNELKLLVSCNSKTSRSNLGHRHHNLLEAEGQMINHVRLRKEKRENGIGESVEKFRSMENGIEENVEQSHIES
jgi:hypothetical protein